MSKFLWLLLGCLQLIPLEREETICVTSTPLKLTPNPFFVCNTSFFWFPESRTLLLIPRRMCYGTGKKDEQAREDSCYLLIETLNASCCNPLLMVHTASSHRIHREFFTVKFDQSLNLLKLLNPLSLTHRYNLHPDFSAWRECEKTTFFFQHLLQITNMYLQSDSFFTELKKNKIMIKLIAKTFYFKYQISCQNPV